MSNAIKLTTLVEYSPGSIVSKQIIKRHNGNITAFAFDEGQELSTHTAPFEVLLQVIDGQAVILLDGEPNQVSAGEAIILPANVPHAVKAAEKFKMVLTMIKD